MTIATGTRFGRYEVRSPLGAGGMGEVYLAQDTRLRRPVALKLLSAKLTQDEDRLRRFEQEACAASALNHPNIITIHEIGQEDSLHFMATEFVEGETLRQRMKRQRLKLREALDIGVQLADALRVAHDAGIVHRDIKPENVMVRPDGYVKVLDFGLAKLTMRQSSMIDSQAPTLANVDTNPGTVMGTAQYMSPEQARGFEVDVRTDIWSLGCVLYEMTTAHAPFTGATTSDVIVSVLEKDPQPLGQHLPEAPVELQRIVRKALRKDREERYQTVKDLLIDLKSLRQELEFESKLEHSLPPEGGGGAAQSTVSDAQKTTVQTSNDSARGPANTTQQPTSSAEYLAVEFKRHKRGALVALAALVLVGAAIAYFVYSRAVKSPVNNSSPTFLQNMQVTQLTTSGKSIDAVISPDGKYVAYVVEEAGKQSVWLRQVATSSNVQILAPEDVSYQGLKFSGDSNFIYYNLWDRKGVGVIYQIPALGGAPPRKIINDTMPGVTVSPDGKHLAFVRGYAARNEGALIVANADGTGERVLVSRKSPDGCYGGAWSPDGKSLAIVLWNDSSKTMSLVEIPADGGPEKLITSQRWAGIGGVSWLGDGSGLVMIAADERKSPAQIWFIPYPSGEPRKITNDLNGYNNLSLTDDSSTMVTVRGRGLANVWVTSAAETHNARQITSGNSEGGVGLAWTPDGRIVYSSIISGNWDLWMMSADGSLQKQLTFDSRANRLPAVSPDGRYIAFVSDRAGTDHIWRINIDGSNPKQLTTVEGDSLPDFSTDGQWVLYTSTAAGKPSTWKVPVEGGTPVQVTEGQTPGAVVSPDGKLLAGSYWNEQANPQHWELALISYPDGKIVRTLTAPITAFGDEGTILLHWTADGRGLAYRDNSGGFSNIWILPIDGGAPKQLTDFKSDRLFWFDLSADGNKIACARGAWNSDVYLIKGFK
jgi:serine/threonine protein kinase/sugar lactone lactonase YvrE